MINRARFFDLAINTFRRLSDTYYVQQVLGFEFIPPHFKHCDYVFYFAQGNCALIV